MPNAPGKSCREGMTLIQLMNRLGTERAATEWFESVLWSLRQHEYSRNTESQASTLPLSRLPQVLLRTHRYTA